MRRCHHRLRRFRRRTIRHDWLRRLVQGGQWLECFRLRRINLRNARLGYSSLASDRLHYGTIDWLLAERNAGEQEHGERKNHCFHLGSSV
jgi:hypothetical protein